MSEVDKEEVRKSMDSKPISVQQIREMIIGSPEKVMLLNVFNGLVEENVNLKKELESKDGKA